MPSKEILQDLCEEPVDAVIRRWLDNKRAKLVEGASVVVRLCDARRASEVPFIDPFSPLFKVYFL